MNVCPPFDWLETGFRLYLDRLPYSDRVDIGAGYTMAAATFVSAILYTSIVSPPTTAASMSEKLSIALWATTLGGFPGGFIIWQSTSDNFAYLRRLLATAVGYIFSVPFILTVFTNARIYRSVLNHVVFWSVIGFFAVAWIYVPVGILFGRLYERSLQ